MRIKKIELNHYRNYDHLELEPHPGINLFFGKNGSGKTNLLEAVHYCALGKSHRLSRDENAVQSGFREGSCQVTVKGKYAQSDIRLQLQPGEANKKTFTIDQTRVKKFSEMMGKLRCVIFSPEDLSMIRGGPSLRRRFLDMMISQVDRQYFIALQQYRSAMEQRNAILREMRLHNNSMAPMLDDFEAAMAESGSVIIRVRNEQIAGLSENCARIYSRISGLEDEKFTMQYHTSLKNPSTLREDMIRQLKASREDDARMAISSVGPHRDDLTLMLNKKDIRLYASQGQVRSSALSMKMAQLKVLTQYGGEAPVLLLDDVMSELDKSRRMHLLEEIEDCQTFITFADETDLESEQNHRTYFVFTDNGNAGIQRKKDGPAVEAEAMAEPDFT